MSDTVTYEVTERVATITIQRPEVRNAMDVDVFGALYELGMKAGADPDVRAVVLTGAPPAFSSGIDTTIFTSAPNGSPASIDVPFFQRAFTIYEQIPKPVIAAVAGPAFGAGFQLALAADLRVVAADAMLSVMEVRWGIIPDLGATQRLPRVVGLGRAKELALTARRFDADEALSIGFANRVVGAGEHLKHATDWARELAAGPPLALAGIKRLMNSAYDEPVATGLEREAAVQRTVLASQDFIEAVRARVEKRDPTFRAR